jgi:DnaD/phage-associated family protein
VSIFSGFPDGALAATPVPNLFFARLLPEIESLAELKVTLHVLWRTSAGPRNPTWLALDELKRDPMLLAGLAGQPGGGGAALLAGLSAAAERGTLLRTTVTYADVEREVVAANTARGRRGLEALRAHASGFPAPAIVDRPVARATGRPPIFELYEQNVGLIQPLIADELRAAAELYPAAWIEDAFHQAVAYNRRNWRYVKRILERWATEGRTSSDATPGRRAASGPHPAPKREWVETYRPGERLPDL